MNKDSYRRKIKQSWKGKGKEKMRQEDERKAVQYKGMTKNEKAGEKSED